MSSVAFSPMMWAPSSSPCFFAVKEFCKSIRLTGGDGLADGDERDFSDDVFDTFRLECTLGFSNRGDLRVAIGAAREVFDLARLVAGDVEAFDALDGFEGCDVGEPWRPDDVASCIDAGDGGFVAFADLDIAAVEFRLQAAGKHGLDADGDEADLRADGAVLLRTFHRDFDRRTFVDRVGDLGVGEYADALFDQAFLQRVTDFIILDGEDARCHFNERHLGTERVVNVGELDSNRACTDDDHFLRLLLENHRFLGTDDRRAVEGECGKAPGFATGGDEDVLGLKKRAAAVRANDSDLAGAFDGTEAADVVDFVLLEKELDATCETV